MRILESGLRLEKDNRLESKLMKGQYNQALLKASLNRKRTWRKPIR